MEQKAAIMRIWLAALLLAIAGSLPAKAEDNSCITPESGSWRAKDPELKHLHRIEVESRCHGEAIAYRIRAFTLCYPRDCKWGWTEGVRIGNSLVVDFMGFFGKRSIRLSAMGERMSAEVHSDPYDPEAADEVYSIILHKE